jgi:hypothetical protein
VSCSAVLRACSGVVWIAQVVDVREEVAPFRWEVRGSAVHPGEVRLGFLTVNLDLQMRDFNGSSFPLLKWGSANQLDRGRKVRYEHAASHGDF